MSDSHEPETDQAFAVESLAQQYGLPIEVVSRLYEGAKAELTMSARVTNFLHIFVVRQVQDALRRHTAGRDGASEA